MDKLQTLMVDGLPVDMTDMAAKIVQRHIDALTKRVTDAEAACSAAEMAAKKKKEEMDAKDGQIAALTKQVADAALTPAKLDALVKDRMAVVDKARKILGDKAVTDGKSEAEIRRAVVVAKLGDEAAKAMSDAAIEGAFATLTIDAKGTQQSDTLARGLSTTLPSPTRDAAHADYSKRLSDAWRPAARA